MIIPLINVSLNYKIKQIALTNKNEKIFKWKTAFSGILWAQNLSFSSCFLAEQFRILVIIIIYVVFKKKGSSKVWEEHIKILFKVANVHIKKITMMQNEGERLY